MHVDTFKTHDDANVMQVEPIVFVMNLPFYVMLANYVGNDGVNIHVNEMVWSWYDYAYHKMDGHNWVNYVHR